jgi:hypothetical protein
MQNYVQMLLKIMEFDLTKLFHVVMQTSVKENQ